ncbi:MAG: CoA transferase [Proteobacteria bacterium]|nr:CoA transferase [Pseudomonadota bacterium]
MTTLKPPLDGIRVLDFSRVIAGPLCTQQLADLGASIIKIENPVTGEEGRRMVDPGSAGRGHFFIAFNRSKRSLALDIRTPEGQEIVHRLLENTDVVVQNFRPGVMARYGLDYPTLKTRYPRLICLSISSYGQTGDLADRPGFDPVLQAEFGMMALTGEPDGPPLRHPLSLIDTMTAHQGVTAVCAALLARNRDGIGQEIDLCLMDVAVQALGNAGLYYLTSGRVPPRTGNSHMYATPTSLFQTATKPVYVAVSTDRLFQQFCRDVLEREDLITDERFASSSLRTTNRPALLAEIQTLFLTQTSEFWLQRMRHLPAGEVRDIEAALTSPEVLSRGMVDYVEDLDAGQLPVLGSPLNFSESPLAEFVAPAHLGEHSETILEELGYTTDQVADFFSRGVINIHGAQAKGRQ